MVGLSIVEGPAVFLIGNVVIATSLSIATSSAKWLRTHIQKG
jgi:hypothetical protein